jgi:hypothetical protein
MADLLANASAWLEQQRMLHLSRSVTYQRGAQSVPVLATIGKTAFEIDDGFGVLQRIESRDFLVLAADLVLDGAATLPQRGDIVAETVGDSTLQYEVTAPGKEPCWRYSDPYRQTLRIHTKQIGAA